MTEKDKKPEEKSTAQNEAETDAPKTDNEHQRKINVGNLPKDVTEQQLREHFSGYEIEKVEIFHYNKNTLALLLFKDKEVASKAISEKDNSMFRDRRLRIHLEYVTIRHLKRDVLVLGLDDESMTEEQLWDKVKSAAGVEPSSVLIFYPLGYIVLDQDVDKAEVYEKLKAAELNVYDVNQRDQNQHLDIWRAAKLFHRNRNRVQLLNIPNKWIEDKEEMIKYCAEHGSGTITEAVSNNTAQHQNASNYARIFYETEEQAAKAATALNGRVVEGKRIHALHLMSALIPNYKTSVYITSLDKRITEEQVFDHFKQFGEIDFVNRRNCNEAAIICFKTAEAAEKALACTTFPAPTDENKDATKEITLKRYNGPIVLRQQGLKRKLKADDGTADNPEHQPVLEKLQSFHPVFVGNVPLDCPPLELKSYFAQHGPIKFMFSPQIITYRTNAPHPVKTFIIYYITENSAKNACKFLDHKFFGGHRLHVLSLRGEQNFDIKKSIKMTKIPYLSEDALFKKIKPYVGKINRIVKKSRLAAYIELNDPADVEKLMKVDATGHPLPKAKMELVKFPTSMRLYNENDSRVLGGISKIIAKNPAILKRGQFQQHGPVHKRPRLNGPGFNHGPGGFNSNNNMNNPQAIQDLLRLAFMSGKNVGENLVSNQNSFNAPDPPLANSSNFGDGGFGNRNRGSQGGNFRGQGRNMNQNQNNRGNNANNFGNSNTGGNFQNAPGNQNRGGQNMMNRGNQPTNQNRTANQNQNQNQNRLPQNKQQGNVGVGSGGNMNQNRNTQGGGGNNMNRNPNRNQNNRNNNFDNDSFGGGNNFGNNRNNFANDNFSNDNFGNNRNNNDNFSNDNFGGNNRSFGGNNRNQNDNFNSFGGGNNSGGNNRFNNDSQQFGGSNFNRNQNNRNFDDDNFGNNQKSGNNFNQNRQNKQFNSNNSSGSGFNQGGGMSFGEFNTSNNSNRGFGGGNSNFSGNAGGGNKWNSNNTNQSSGSRLAGSIFSRRF